MSDEVAEIRATILTLKQALQQLEVRLIHLETKGAAVEDGAAASAEPGTQAAQHAAACPPVPAPSSGVPGDPHGTGGSVPMAATRVVMHQIVMPALTDSLGICFGGEVLSWIDLCAGMSAKTLARGPCVTATVDAVHFLQPCRLGSVVIIAAMVNRTFNTSMEVGVRVEAEDMRTGVRVHCCSAYLTFVSVKPGHGHTAPARLSSIPHKSPESMGMSSGATTAGGVTAAGGRMDGPPAAALPRVVPGGAEQRRIHDEAEARRQERLAERTRARADPALAAARERCRLKPITHREGGPTLPPSIITPNRSVSHFMGSGHSTPHWRTATWPAGHTPSQSPPPAAFTPGGTSSGGAACLSRAESANQVDDRSSTGGGGTVLLPPSAVRTGSSELAAEAVARVGQLLTGLSTSDSVTTSGRLLVSGAAVAATTDQESASGATAGAGVVGLQLPQPQLPTAVATGAQPHNQHHQLQGVPRPVPRHCVAPGLTEAYMTQQVMPQHANSIAITFGGQVMSWMEQCAYISASRLRAPHILTAAMDTVTFVKATKVGHILYVTSQVTAIFGSSLEVMVSIHGEDPTEGKLFHCADAYVTLVAVAGVGDAAPGAPVQLPFQLQPVKEEEVMRYQGALQRRQQRLRMRSQLVQAASARTSLDGSLPIPLPTSS